jgi:hypothetical protein
MQGRRRRDSAVENWRKNGDQSEHTQETRAAASIAGKNPRLAAQFH